MSSILKRNKDFIILSIIFIIFVLVMILLTISFSYFFSVKKITSEITLGELDYEINVKANNLENIMPGDKILISTNIINKVNQKQLIPFYFRYKFIDENLNDNDLISTYSDNFMFFNNYYYYKYKVNINETVLMFDFIEISNKMTKEDIDSASFQVIVDAVQTEYGAVYEVFDDAPEEWFKFIENN